MERGSSEDHARPISQRGFGVQSHTMAFQALTMSLIQHGKNYIALQNDVDNLPRERRNQIQRIRKKKLTRRENKRKQVQESHEEHVQHAHEMIAEMNQALSMLDNVRCRFYQQIQDTHTSGLHELAEHNASRLLYLETKGAEALAHLSDTREGIVEASLLAALLARISSVREALTRQMEWLPELSRLVHESSTQYRSILEPAL
jgi:hypothetical protein